MSKTTIIRRNPIFIVESHDFMTLAELDRSSKILAERIQKLVDGSSMLVVPLGMKVRVAYGEMEVITEKEENETVAECGEI